MAVAPMAVTDTTMKGILNLGYAKIGSVSSEGIYPDPGKVSAISNLPSPTDAK